MFEHERMQEQVGRVSWGRRTFGPSAAAQADDSFILPDTQHFWTPFEPYVNGKNDGLLECANSGDQAQLVNNLLLHTVLKTADICIGNPDGSARLDGCPGGGRPGSFQTGRGAADAAAAIKPRNAGRAADVADLVDGHTRAVAHQPDHRRAVGQRLGCGARRRRGAHGRRAHPRVAR